jgi:hypothetical protein
MTGAGPEAMPTQQTGAEQQNEAKQTTSALESVRARAAVTVSGLDLDDED